MKPGDLVLFSALDPSWPSQAIIDTQRNGGHHPTNAQWHHAAVYIGENQLCEANFPNGVRVCSLLNYIPNYKILVRRDPDLLVDETWKICIQALTKMGRKYSVKDIIKVYLLSINPLGFVNKKSVILDRISTICSRLYAESYADVTGTFLVKGKQGLEIPAELSITQKLQDLDVGWVSIR